MEPIRIMSRDEYRKKYWPLTPDVCEDVAKELDLTVAQINDELEQAFNVEYKLYVDEQVNRIRSIQI